MSPYTGPAIQSTPRTVLLCLQLTKGEAAKPQAPPRTSTTFWKWLHLAMWSINRIFALETWKSRNIIFCHILQDERAFIIWDHPWISIFSPPRGMEYVDINIMLWPSTSLTRPWSNICIGPIEVGIFCFKKITTVKLRITNSLWTTYVTEKTSYHKFLYTVGPVQRVQ